MESWKSNRRNLEDEVQDGLTYGPPPRQESTVVVLQRERGASDMRDVLPDNRYKHMSEAQIQSYQS